MITVEPCINPVITTETLLDAEAGTAYSAKVEATGTTPITWSVTDGSLPPGLSLNASTGVISGTPE
ncbi:MAG: putative Ig domain-containing protein [Synergistaceae bacterium]|nr:putative Ig domain-containing protein [Synergistaceae bacterium]